MSPGAVVDLAVIAPEDRGELQEDVDCSHSHPFLGDLWPDVQSEGFPE